MESFGSYLFTQGILGVAVAALGIVVVYQQKKIDKKDQTHADEIKALNALLLSEVREHATNYQEMAKREQDVMFDTSHTLELFSEKIEVVKGRR